jgi:hypothetical protein
METQLVSQVVAEYVELRFKRLLAESDAQHREPSTAEFYERQAWQMKNIGEEIVRHLVSQGL